MSIVCGVAIGGALGRALSSLLFGIGPLDPSVLASVAALIVGVTVEASAVPLWRASRIDPMVAHKTDRTREAERRRVDQGELRRGPGY